MLTFCLTSKPDFFISSIVFFLIVLCFSKTTSAHSSIGKFKSNDSARSVTLHSDGTLSEMIHGNPAACASIIESGNPSYKDVKSFKDGVNEAKEEINKAKDELDKPVDPSKN